MSGVQDTDRADRPSTAQPAPIPSRPDAVSVHTTAAARLESHGFGGLAELLRERGEFGRRKYGTTLTPGNGRRWDLDALEEVLDAIAYAEQGRREASARGDAEQADAADRIRWRAIALAEALRMHAATRQVTG